MGILLDVRARAEDTGSAFSLFEDTIWPGEIGPPEHNHSPEDEFLLPIHGSLVVLLAGRPHEMHAGDFFHVPRGVPRYFRNRSSDIAHALLGYTPGPVEHWSLHITEPAMSRLGRPSPPSAEQTRRAFIVAASCSVRFTSPPA